MANTLLGGSKVSLRQIEHASAGRIAGTTDVQNLPDLLQRKPQSLAFFDESEFFQRGLAIMSIARLRAPGRRQKAEFFVVPRMVAGVMSVSLATSPMSMV